MTKINQHIQIARTTINGLSSLSEISSVQIYNILKKHYSKVEITFVNSLEDLEMLVQKKPDMVFLGFKYVEDANSNKVWAGEFLNQHSIKHTGSDFSAQQLELHKEIAKQKVLDGGMKTAKFFVSKFNQAPILKHKLIYPLFVKPTSRGGGTGVDIHSFVNSNEELATKILSISNTLQADSIVEEYLPGREFSVAILKKQTSKGFYAMPLELVAIPDTKGNRMLSKDVKSHDAETVLLVKGGKLKDDLTTLALDVFKALNGRDYGRVDIRLDALGVPHFLEANLIPSLTDNFGSFPKACKLIHNMSHEDVILYITSLALERKTT